MKNEANMFLNICRQRRSVRGFLDQPLDQEIVQSILQAAQLTPSSCNTQPWKVHVVSGEKCRQLSQRFVEVMNEGGFQPDFEHSMKYSGVYRERQIDAAQQLYGAMSIEREDKAARHEAFLNNFRFFNAPHVAFIGMDEGFALREAVDLGMYAQTFMLACASHGVASCPQNALSFNGEMLRKELGIEDQWRVLFGISFGYEDTSVDANNARVGRAKLDESVTFHQ